MVKTRVGVVRGGPSNEYDVSLRTGAEVIRAIDAQRFQPIDIVITKNGEWIRDGYTRFPEAILGDIDIVFIALHGTYGEDGTLQRFLESHKIPYIGSRPLASRIAMNKPLAKDQLRDHGIKMPPHIIVTRESYASASSIAKMIVSHFGPEYVIKPISEGSSVGVVIVENAEMLPLRIREALNAYNEILVEKRIRGKEATCGVIERFRTREVYALPPIEIIPPVHAGYFSANVKYNGETREVCPGRFSKGEKAAIEDIAKKVHTILGLSQYSRSDFMVDEGGVYFLEVNTLPGLTGESLFPKAMDAVGSSFSELVNHLITDRLQHV